jgi:hypothetical protein
MGGRTVVRYLVVVVVLGIAFPVWLTADLSTPARAVTGALLLAACGVLVWQARRRLRRPGSGPRGRRPPATSHDGGFMPRRRLGGDDDDIETRHHPSW